MYGKVAEQIQKILGGPFSTINLKMFDKDGMETSDAYDSRWFYLDDPNLVISIDDDTGRITLNKAKDIDPQDCKSLIKQIKLLVGSNPYLSYRMRNFGEKIYPKMFAQEASSGFGKKRNVNEMKTNLVNESTLSKMYGSKRTSYQILEDVRIVVRHNKPVDESIKGSRSRNISKIILEQGDDSFQFPYKNLSGARAMARHLVNEGNFEDQVGSYILENTKNKIQLMEFIGYVKKNKLLSEDTSNTVYLVRENLDSINKDLSRLSGAKTYYQVAERINQIQVTLNEDPIDIDSLRDQFTVKKFENKFEGILPVLGTILQERNSLLCKIDEAVESPIRISKGSFAVSDLVFDSNNSKLSHIIESVRSRIIENDLLVEYLGKISKKLLEGIKMDDFESSVLTRFFENIEEVEESDLMNEPLVEGLSLSENIGLVFESKLETRLSRI